MIKDERIKDVLRNEAEKFGVNIKDIEEVIDSMYYFIYEKVSKLDMRNMTYEDFLNTKKNFYIPALFKFYASEYNFKRLNINNKDE